MRYDLCCSGDGFSCALLPPSIPCEAYADACADASAAGLGGFIRLPDGRQCCFQHTFRASELAKVFAWFPSDANPQHFIASWEMAAQVALLWCMQRLLGPCHLPVHCVFRTDNSASESACWKALSLARGMCVLLSTFLLLQRRFHTYVHLDCVPGFLNVIADRLSRGSPPAALGLLKALGFLPSHVCLSLCLCRSRHLPGLPVLVFWVEASPHSVCPHLSGPDFLLPTETKGVSARLLLFTIHPRRNGLVCLNDSVLVRFCLVQSQRQVYLRSRLAQAAESSF